MSRTARIGAWVGIVLTLAVGVLCARGFRCAAVWPQDEGMMLAYPEMMLEGKRPNRDFFIQYGPGAFWILAGAYDAFGVSVGTERAVGAAFRLAIGVGLVGLAGFAGLGAALATALVALYWIVPTGIMALPWHVGLGFQCLFLAAGFWARRAPENRWLAGLAGALAMSAITVRFDSAPFIAVSALALFRGVSMGTKRSFAFGAGLAGLPLGIHALDVGPLAMAREAWIESVRHIAPHRYLGLIPTPDLRARAIAICLLTGTVFALAFFSWRRKRPEAPALLAAAVLAVGILRYLFMRADEHHLNSVECALWPLAAAVIFLQVGGQVLRTTAIAVAALAIGFAARDSSPLVGALLTGIGARPPWCPRACTRGRCVPLDSFENAERVQAMLDALETRAARGDRVLAGPRDLSETHHGDTYIHFMLPWLRPSTHAIEMNPGQLDRPDSELVTALRSTDWLWLNAKYDALEFTGKRRPTTQINEAARRLAETQFEKIATLGDWELRRRLGTEPLRAGTEPE